MVTVLRFLPPGGAERAFEFSGDPGLVRLDPRWQQAAWRFVVAGFRHILDGTDHLLFLLCLVIPLRRPRALVAIVLAGVFLAIARAPLPPRDMVPAMLVFGICVVIAYPVLMGTAMRYAPASHGGVVLAVQPLITALAREGRREASASDAQPPVEMPITTVRSGSMNGCACM